MHEEHVINKCLTTEEVSTLYLQLCVLKVTKCKQNSILTSIMSIQKTSFSKNLKLLWIKNDSISDTK
jgi:hypothetical protein